MREDYGGCSGFVRVERLSERRTAALLDTAAPSDLPTDVGSRFLYGRLVGHFVLEKRIPQRNNPSDNRKAKRSVSEAIKQLCQF